MFSGLSSVSIAVFVITVLSLVLVTGIPDFAQAFNFHTPSLLQSSVAILIGVSTLVLFDIVKRLYLFIYLKMQPAC